MRFKDHYTKSPKAAYERAKYLTDDAFAEKRIAYNKQYYRRKKCEAVVESRHSIARWISRGHESQIKHHISKGRDAGDIAIRMNIPVSYVVQAIERINHDQPNPTQPKETP